MKSIRELDDWCIETDHIILVRHGKHCGNVHELDR
jgi:hypothetical protein